MQKGTTTRLVVFFFLASQHTKTQLLKALGGKERPVGVGVGASSRGTAGEQAHGRKTYATEGLLHAMTTTGVGVVPHPFKSPPSPPFQPPFLGTTAFRAGAGGG